MFKAKTVAAAAGLVMAFAAAGCGSNGDGTKSTSSAGSAATDKGSIKVMAIGPLEGAKGFSLTTIPDGAKAAANEINAAGGVDGRKIEVLQCNDNNDPNGAATCARKAVSEKVVALVGGFSSGQASIVPILTKAKIPWIGASSAADYKSPILYLTGGDPASVFFGMAQDFADNGCTNMTSLAEDIGPVRQAEKLVQLGAAAAKIKYLKPVFAPENAADWGPSVSSAAKEGAKCLALVMGPTVAPRAIAAIAKDPSKMMMASSEATVPPQAVTALGDAAEGFRAVVSYLPNGADDPELAKLTAAVRDVAPDHDVDTFTKQGWAAVNIVAEAAKGSSDLTGESLIGVLPQKITKFDTGLGPVIDFSKPNAAADFARVFNPIVYVEEVKGGKYVVANGGKSIDTTPAFQILAKSAG
jgi:ABC-type branched-subunit amino acid transport system substrate-binding protein